MVTENRGHRRDEPWRAEAALQAVAVAEGRLHLRKAAVGRGDAFDRRDFCAIGLDGEHEARTHGGAVDQHCAGPAHTVLTSEVRTGEPAPIAEEVGQGQTRLDGLTPTPAIHGHVHRYVSHCAPPRPPLPTSAPPWRGRRAS